jgi:hypothetical protein
MTVTNSQIQKINTKHDKYKEINTWVNHNTVAGHEQK